MKIIGVTGGKGGTGKSTVATALAFELARTEKVLLVDADVDCPNDHLLLNIERKVLAKVEQRIPNWDLDRCTKCGLCGTVCKTNAIVSVKSKNPIFMQQQCNGCGSCVFKCPVDAISWGKKEIGIVYSGIKDGLHLLSGELKINEPVSEFVVKELKQHIKDDYDYVIIDTAAGTHCDVIAALEICEEVIAVTEPTPLGAHDLALILDLAHKLKKKVSVVLNRAGIGDGILIQDICKKHDAKKIADIPYSKKIIEQYSKGIPIQHESITGILENIR